MNANDIAEMIEKQPWHTNINRVAIANFVRQQQAEIEALKEALSIKVILNEHAQQAMKRYKELLK